MNIKERNILLFEGKLEERQLFPSLEKLANKPFFRWDFGLHELPNQPGIIIVRGPRQYGKSTWLEFELKKTIITYGAGSAFYLNGDYISDIDRLEQEIKGLIELFKSSAAVRRIFIDEITAIKNWQKCLKRMVDAGELNNVLLITTGSKARDIYREAERLPGRKGGLSRSTYIFTQISYSTFFEKAKDTLKQDALAAYIISGGSPVACVDLLQNNVICSDTFETIRDWVYGECARRGLSRASLLRLIEQLFVRGAAPAPQTTLALESGMANNTVAATYIEFLHDLLILGQTEPWDLDKQRRLARKASKYPFINLLAANVWSPNRMISTQQWNKLPQSQKGIWYEWCVAAELYRRAAIAGKDLPQLSAFWQSKDHEIDFICDNQVLIEVKSGECSPLDFAWFRKTFPNKQLQVVSNQSFDTDAVLSINLEEFLG